MLLLNSDFCAIGVVVLDALRVCAVAVVAVFLSCTFSPRAVTASSFISLSLYVCASTVGVVVMAVDGAAAVVLNKTKRSHRW